MSKVNFKERATALLRQDVPAGETAGRIVERPDDVQSLRAMLERCSALLGSVTSQDVAGELSALAPVLIRIVDQARDLANGGYAIARARKTADDLGWLD